MPIKNNLYNIKQDKKLKRKILILSVSSLIIIIGIILLPYLISFYFSPKRLIRNTTLAIEKFTGAKIKIERAKLSLNGKIIFYNVSVFVPPDKMQHEPMFSSEDAKLFDAKKFEINLKRRNFLSLKFSLKSINVINPKFHLAKIKYPDNRKSKWNWEMLFYGITNAERERRQQKRFNVGPKITLQNGQIDLIEISAKNRLFMGQINFTASAIPMKHFYRIMLKTWTTQNQGPVAFIDFDPLNGRILAGKMESISWKNLELTLPHPYKEFCKQYHLSGKIGMQLVGTEKAEQPQIILILEDVQACLPFSNTNTKNSKSVSCNKLFMLSELNGKLIFYRKQVIIDNIQGKLNGAKCVINGIYEGYSSNLADIAFNIRIKADDFICPDYTDPKQYPIIEHQFPWKLRCLFHDFKPKGKVDMNITLTKKKGSSDNFLINGNVILKHISAEYFKFPYRADNITGKILIENNSFKLIGLKGESDGGKITLDGFISEPSKFSAVDIEIHTQHTPLNRKLFNALPPHYQKVWKMFNPKGYGNSDIILHRRAGKNQNWHRKITLVLTKAQGCYDKFKYPINNLSGVMYVENNTLYLRHLQGKDANASLEISGIVQHINTNKPQVNIKILAKNVPIDNTLINALPPQAGQLIRNCQLKGITDFDGELHSNNIDKTNSDNSDNKSPLNYTFKCKLKKIRICHKDFPYPIENLKGTLTITPKHVIINGVFARKDNQQLRASGKLILGQRHQEITLKIFADNIPIDSQLYKALNPTQKRIWNALAPSGKIKIEATLKQIKALPWKWHIIALPKQCQIKYEKFPPISNLTGVIEFSSNIITFKTIKGTINNHPIILDGQLKSSNGRLTSNLKLTIDEMPITEKFLSIFDSSDLTSKLKWTKGGTLRCNLTKLTIEHFPDGKQHWVMIGNLELRGASIAAFSSKPVNCEFDGQIEWQEKRQSFAINGNLTLDKFEWSNRVLKNLKCQITKRINSEMLHIKNITSKFAGGDISGLAELNLTGKQINYGIQLTLNNVEAGKALGIDNNKTQEIHGKMRGQIYLLGKVGAKYFKRAGGTLEIIGAQVLKIPLMQKVYASVKQKPPNLASFHNIILNFTIENYILKFQRITLIGPTLSLMGNGRINLSNKRIKLYLISAPPNSVNGFPILKELIQGASTELTEIEVHGTTDKPIINAKPLKNISDTLKAFSEGQ